jgi:hypothetical protein
LKEPTAGHFRNAPEVTQNPVSRELHGAARSKTSEAQDGIRHTIADMTRVEAAQNTSATEADKNRLASEMDRLKGGLSSINKLEQDRLSNQQEAEALLRKTQDAYDAIEDQLNALMKTLRTAQEVGNK